MTEQEFKIESKKRGLRDENIENAIDTYNRMKNENVNITYEVIMEYAVKIQEKIDNLPEDTIIAD